ncbi:CASP-like protein 5B3 [Panicum miliaceum]|uniref:CASP-like protein 5B3 n=1 Tax=Panicum miliaceum TaxID=4540 RepID=A0A3L6QNW8_PANMI|nr:CASP-like protein 5B3 [Panicum miliaceum]
MKDIMGSPGTLGGLALRVSQFVCAAGSLAAMLSAYGFSNYSAFCWTGVLDYCTLHNDRPAP